MNVKSTSSVSSPTHLPSIPDDFVDKLSCSECISLLSVPPIYSLPGGSSICGRCVNIQNPKGSHNQLYETIMEFTIYPCMNKKFGCLESRSGKTMFEHEIKCPYRRVNCPTFSSTSCDWIGEVDNMLEHFEKNHVTHLMQEPSFEVNFVHNYDEICLLPYADRLFLVRKHGDVELKEFGCSVTSIFTNENEKFKYCLKLKNPANNSSLELPEKIAVGLSNLDDVKIKADDIEEKLHNPSTIIASIDITECVEETSEEVNKKDEFLSESNLEMLKIIECPVCFEYMVPPIYQCSGGHSICGECRSQVQQCPTCQKSFGETQNYAVESFTSFLKYPCKNSERGCKYLSSAKEIKQHEKLCKFGVYSCPAESYTSCKWTGKRQDIFGHCKVHHTDNIMESPIVSLPYDASDQNEDDEEFFILKYLKDIFVLHWNYNSEEEKFYWSLQFIGPLEESKKYNFDLDIIDRSGRNLRIFMRCPCEFYSEKEFAFESNRSFLMLSLCQVKPFINEVFSFKLSVLMIK